MAMIKVGPNNYVAEDYAKKLGLKTYKEAPTPSRPARPKPRTATPPPPPPAPSVRRAASPPISIAAAMTKGMTNAEIHKGIRAGTVRTYANRNCALREDFGSYHEMLRRGLI